MKRLRLSLLALCLGACGGASGVTPYDLQNDAPPTVEQGGLARPSASALRAPEAPETELHGVIEAPEGDKAAFSGAILETDAGEKVVLDYSNRSLFRQLKGQRVKVTGRRATQEGRSINLPSFAVEALWAEDHQAPIASIGREMKLTGHFVLRKGNPDERMSEDRIQFVGDGTYEILLADHESITFDKKVTVTARLVAQSPFIRSTGGPHLWISAVNSP